MLLTETAPRTHEQFSEILDVNEMGRNIMDLAVLTEQPITNDESEHDITYLSFDRLVKDYWEIQGVAGDLYTGGRLIFTRGGKEIQDMDGYNMTQPIYDIHYDPESGKPDFTVGVRLEKRDDEIDSQIDFFRADMIDSKTWDQIDDLNLLRPKGQDPSMTWVGDELVLGVVAVERVQELDPSKSVELRWKTLFFKGPNISNLERFAEGPPGMKDIRLAELPNGKIAVFTRPQNIGNEEGGGRGQIGVVMIDSIDQLKDPDILQNAPLTNTRFEPDKEWGGVNQAIALSDGRVGLLMHIGRFDPEEDYAANERGQRSKEYAALLGFYNPSTNTIDNIEVVAMADEFEGAMAKNPFLKKVAFGSAMGPPNENDIVRLYLGIGDAESWHKDLKDRFVGLRLPDRHYPMIT